MASHEPDSYNSSVPLPPSGGHESASVADPLEFRRLFDAHFEELARYAYRYVQSIDEAKDLVHDAFFRLWRQREEVDFRSSVRAYLYATVRNLAVDQLRRKRVDERWRRRLVQSIGAGPRVAPDNPDRDLVNGEVAAAVWQAVATLPPRQQEVIMLRWHRHASYDEIAQTLGISPKTVGIHVTRALASLRDALSHLLDRTSPTPTPAKPRE